MFEAAGCIAGARGVLVQEAAETYEFGSFTLETNRRTLLLSGEKVALSSRAFDILALLLAERGRVVGREELVDRVWGGMAVGQNNLAVQMSALRAALSAQSGGDRLILTVPGRGYRFVGDVVIGRRPVAPSQGSAFAATGRSPLPQTGRERLPRALSLSMTALTVLLLATLLGWRFLGPSHQAAPRFSIAVLPFRNLSTDRAQDYLADAVTDDLTTDLSHIPGSVVIARESADAFRGRTQGAQATGRALNVRYLLEGSTRTEGGLIHTNAQLIDAESGIQLSAEQFDVPREPINEAQSAIVGRIAMSLASKLGQVEAARSLHDRPNDPDAVDLFFRARSILDRDRTQRGFASAQGLLEQAIRQQPEFVDALATLAWTLITKIQAFDDPDEARDFGESKALIARALRVAPRNATALAAQGLAQASEGDCQAAGYSAQAALDIDMNEIKALKVRVSCAEAEGRLDDVAQAALSLIRRDPQNASTNFHYLEVANARLLQEHYGEALDLVRRGMAGDPEPRQEDRSEVMGRAEFARLLLIGALALHGDREEASRAYAAYAAIWPNRSVWRVSSYFYKSQTALPGFRKFQNALVSVGMPQYARDTGLSPAVGDSRGAADFSAVPQAVAGVVTIDASELSRLLQTKPPPIIIDLGSGDALIKGAFWYGPDVAAKSKAEFVRDSAAKASGGDFGRPIAILSEGVYGVASYEAARQLQALGYRNILWFRAGEEGWAEAGLPAESVRK